MKYYIDDLRTCETVLKTSKKEKKSYKGFKKLLKKGFKAFLIVGLLFILFFILNSMAEAERGYKAIGGEGLIFVLPLFIVTIRDTIHEFIDKRNK